MAVGDVLQEQLDFLVRDDVADVLHIGCGGERQADHLVAGQNGAAAVARVDCGIDLDAQARGEVVVIGEFDARDDALGDRQRRAAGRVAVGIHGILDLGQDVGALRRLVRGEEGLVVELDHGQVDAACDGHHRGGNLVAAFLGLHLDLARIAHHVGIGQDAVAFNHHTRAGDFLRRGLAPGAERIGRAQGGENLDHGAFELGRLRRARLVLVLRLCSQRQQAGRHARRQHQAIRVKPGKAARSHVFSFAMDERGDDLSRSCRR